MYTQCPECDTVYPVSADALSVARGNVRCGNCGAVFFAVTSLSETLDEDGQIPTCFHSDHPPTLTDPDAEELPMDDLFWPQAPGEAEAAEPAEASADPEAEMSPVSGIATRLASERAARNRSRGTWLWGAWSGLLAATLAVQWFSSQHDLLARNPTWRPWVVRICVVFGCDIEMPRSLQEISLVSRSIEPHPSVDGALLISATMQNQAEFPQPHPVVEITMADLSGNPVAMRRFGPAEYLDGLQPAGMAPGHLLPLVFEVIDPGENAVAFEFTFR